MFIIETATNVKLFISVIISAIFVIPLHLSFFLTDPDSLDFELDEDSMHAIQPYIFTYQKLYPIFRQALA